MLFGCVIMEKNGTAPVLFLLLKTLQCCSYLNKNFIWLHSVKVTKIKGVMLGVSVAWWIVCELYSAKTDVQISGGVFNFLLFFQYDQIDKPKN